MSAEPRPARRPAAELSATRPAPSNPERVARGLTGIPEGDRFFGLIPVEWRLDLTARFPWLRTLLRSRWTSYLLQIAGLLIFIPALLAGWIGTPVGNANLIIVVVWIFWWSLLMLVMVPFGARVWCAICPLPSGGEWLQRKRFIGKLFGGRLLGLGKKWPKRLRNMWPVNFIFLALALFSGILTTRPWATALMLSGIIVGAIILSLVYERRTFCRYLCPVGGFLGLYANFATLEVRHNAYSVCRDHKQKECVVGTELAHACPWLESPTTMTRNTYCGLCFECFRTCSMDNMSLRLRPPAVDLLVDRHRGLDEAWKAFIMLGAAAIYASTMMGPWALLKDWANVQSVGGYLAYIGILVVAVLAVVPALFGAFVWVGRRWSGGEVPFRRLFTNLSYSLVPIGLMAWIAFSFAIVFPNGSYVVRIISDPFGWGWNLFGTADLHWTPFGLKLLPYLQVFTLLLGLLLSLEVGFKVARQTLGSGPTAARAMVPLTVFLAAVAAGFTWLFVG